MKKVKQEPVYLTPSTKTYLTSIDFADTFSTTNHVDSINELSQLIFETAPRWVMLLFKVRNKIVSFLKLNIQTPELEKAKTSSSFFKIYDLQKNKIVLGADDSHLNFRAVINNTESRCYNIKVTTLVQYKNNLGKLYMFFIKPFHVIIVKQMVKQAYK